MKGRLEMSKGNYMIRIPFEEVYRKNLKAGDEIDIELTGPPKEVSIDLSTLPTFEGDGTPFEEIRDEYYQNWHRWKFEKER